MITDVFDLRRTTEPGFLPIRQHSLKQMRVLRFLTRRINEAWIRRRVLRFELLDRFEVSRVGHDLVNFYSCSSWFNCVWVFFSSTTAVLMIIPLFFGLSQTYARTKDRQRQNPPVV